MGKTSFEKLKVYDLSERLSDRIWEIASRWDRFAKDTLGAQLVKAIDSVGANIAEGVGRFNRADNRRFVLIARGSLYETRHWLRRAFLRGLIERNEAKEMARMLDDLSKTLAGYLRSLSAKVQASQL